MGDQCLGLTAETCQVVESLSNDPIWTLNQNTGIEVYLKEKPEYCEFETKSCSFNCYVALTKNMVKSFIFQIHKQLNKK